MTNLDQFDDVDIISEELDKIYKRLNTLRKKSKLWGITDDEKIKLNFNGAKGGISGKKACKNEEWLSVFR